MGKKKVHTGNGKVSLTYTKQFYLQTNDILLGSTYIYIYMVGNSQ